MSTLVDDTLGLPLEQTCSVDPEVDLRLWSWHIFEDAVRLCMCRKQSDGQWAQLSHGARPAQPGRTEDRCGHVTRGLLNRAAAVHH